LQRSLADHNTARAPNVSCSFGEKGAGEKDIVFLCGQKLDGNEFNKDYLNNLAKSLKQSER
jgi:hypothetical protein